MVGDVDSIVFLTAFHGERVRFLLNANFQVQMATEDGIHSNQTPVIVEAFVINADEYFVYVGHNEREVTQAVNLRHIIHVEIINESELLEDIMEDIDPSMVN